jgi:putative ABC transport system permease protein
LGTKPLLGRALLPEEDQKEGNRAAVLGYELWQRQFAGNSNVIGQTLTVDSYGRREYAIVGIMPHGFGAPGQSELWLPLGWMGVSLDERRSAHWHYIIARLKPGATLAQARSEMNAIQARLKHEFPDETIGSEVAVVPLLIEALGRNLRTALLVLWGVVAGVLLIACANVANLMLARAAARQKEIALRFALGAESWRVLRQLLTESVVLALIGGTLGVFLGWWALRLFIAISPAGIPRLEEVVLDRTALAFTLGISLFTGIFFGLVPAWQFSRPDLNEALKEGARAVSSGTTAVRTHSVLIVAEVALSMVLLIGAGLMLQSFARMSKANRGFQPDHLLTTELDFSVSGFTTWVRPTATRPQVPLHELLQRLRALPGVQAVGAGSSLLRRENRPPSQPVSMFGQPTFSPEEQPRAEFKGITPDWVRALGARVLRGRDFNETDVLEAPGAVLINESFARRFFPNQDPVGQRLKMGSSQPPVGATNVWGLPEWSTIIGVISDVKSLHPRPETVPEVYQSYWQWPMQSPTLLIRTTGDPAMLAEAIRRETKTTLSNLPPPSIRTMDGLLSDTVAQPRLQTELLSLFAGLALLLAAVGLYGVLAYAIAQRTREIGLRMALGARKYSVLWLIIGHGMKLALVGVVVGLLLAFALTRVLTSLLYGVHPTDPLTLLAVSLLLLFVALLASWLPARRASRIHPMEALRYE